MLLDFYVDGVSHEENLDMLTPRSRDILAPRSLFWCVFLRQLLHVNGKYEWTM
jgi:hypothetical protein